MTVIDSLSFEQYLAAARSGNLRGTRVEFRGAKVVEMITVDDIWDYVALPS